MTYKKTRLIRTLAIASAFSLFLTTSTNANAFGETKVDGEYSVSAELTGGSGKAYVSTPTLMTVKDGKAYARLEWSSSNYDYMIVGTETYYNLAEEDRNSVFEIPIGCWDTKMSVIADTTAMGTPHEVQYDITFYESSIGDKGQLPQEGAKRVVFVALIIILAGGILNHFVKKKRRV